MGKCGTEYDSCWRWLTFWNIRQLLSTTVLFRTTVLTLTQTIISDNNIIIPRKIYDSSPGFKPPDLLQVCTNIILSNFSAMATLGTEEILLAVERVQHHGRFRNRRQFEQSALPESCSQLHKRLVDSFHNLYLNCLNCFLLQKKKARIIIWQPFILMWCFLLVCKARALLKDGLYDWYNVPSVIGVLENASLM